MPSLVLIGLALLLVFGVYRVLIRSGILPPVDRKTSGFWIACAPHRARHCLCRVPDPP